RMEVVPGPSALTAAVSACPFDLDRFTYGGFPPREPAVREAWLADLTTRPEAVILLDTPYRLGALLTAVAKIAPDRRVALALDIAGEQEQYIVGRTSDVANLATSQQLADQKLNFVLIIEGKPVKVGRPSARRRP